MSEAGGSPAATAIAHPASAAPVDPSKTASDEIEDFAVARVATRARALRLSQQLRLHVVIDAAGWLRTDAELHHKREHGRSIRPVMLRVRHEADDRALLANGGILGRCRRYNEALDRLRQLALQLAVMLREHRIQLVPGTEIASAHAELIRLDETIAQRQATQMGNRAVRLDVLVAETAYFDARSAALTSIVLAAEQSASATWDGDTLDDVLDHRGTERREEL